MMWATPSYSLIILLICLIKVGEIRAQCERPLFGENRVLADETGQSIFPDGATVTFRCSTGYQQSGGSKTITCTGKEWTNLELQCKKKSCGSLGELSNGRYLTPNGILFGATAVAECNEGFLLVGPKTRNCLDNGWDQRDPVCEAVKCLPPPDIQNGNFHPTGDSYNYNEAVTYSCSAGFTLIGEDSISCSADGTFKPSPPQCSDIKCDAPIIDQGEKIEGKSPPYKYKDFVRYRCKKGYTMTGSDFLTCEVNGWNPSLPVCTGPRPGPSPNPNPDPNPNPGPNPDPNPDPNPNPNPDEDYTRKVGIGIGITIAVVLVASGIGVYFVKKRTGWGKVPTRNGAGA